MEKILFLIIILVVIYFLFPSKKEGFEDLGIDYESITLSKPAKEIGLYADTLNPYDNSFYGHKGYMNPMDGVNYAQKVADDLQKPFGYPKQFPEWNPMDSQIQSN